MYQGEWPKTPKEQAEVIAGLALKLHNRMMEAPPEKAYLLAIEKRMLVAYLEWYFYDLEAYRQEIKESGGDLDDITIDGMGAMMQCLAKVAATHIIQESQGRRVPDAIINSFATDLGDLFRKAMSMGEKALQASPEIMEVRKRDASLEAATEELLKALKEIDPKMHEELLNAVKKADG